jgi:hypothetical protein
VTDEDIARIVAKGEELARGVLALQVRVAEARAFMFVDGERH